MHITQTFGKNSAAICFLLFALALAVRFIGLDYGYFHGDERVNEAARVLTGQLIPDQHFYPPFIHYLNATALAGLFGTGLIAGWWSGPAGFRDAYFTDPTAFYVSVRILTAVTSALLAPLFYLIARQLQLSKLWSIGVGLCAVALPLAVFMAHIGKGDTGLAVALVAAFGALIRRMQSDRPARWDLLLGLCVTLAVSFKHSAVFILVPLAIGMIVLIARSDGLKQALQAFGTALIPVILLWPIFNIGIVLDLKNFLDFQKIQGVMSLRVGTHSVFDGPRTLVNLARHMGFGITPVFALMAMLTPALLLWRHCRLPQKSVLMVIWVSLVLGSLSVAVITGPRQPEHLWIANFSGFTLLAALVLAGLGQSATAIVRQTTTAVFALGLAAFVWGSIGIQRQAIAPSTPPLVAQFLIKKIAQEGSDPKILTAIPLPLPQQLAAITDEQARAARLALKYDVDLPPLAEERLSSAPQNALYYRALPAVMGGLENVKDGDVDYIVKAHTWPLQPEEWQLETWLAQGFSLFVVKDFDAFAFTTAPKMRQDFYRSLDATCQILNLFEPKKPLFLEREVRIYQCPLP